MEQITNQEAKKELMEEARKKEAKWLSDLETLKTHYNKFQRDSKGFLKKDEKQNAEEYMRVSIENSDRFVDEENEKIRKERESEKFKKLGYDVNILNQALEKFKDKQLLKLILQELSKTHIGDDKLKMTLFLVCASGLLKNHKRRQSMGIVGNTSIGKNNVIETDLEHMPKESYIYVSNATQSTIEDDLKGKKIIAFKEMNFKKEDGANKHLLEILKQVTEGGTSAIKKDIRTGLKTSRFEEDEQKTIIYPTTESERDLEAETRFIFGNASSDYNKIKKVNDNTCDNFADLDKILNDSVKVDSWIRIGLTYFYNDNKYEIYLPYAKLLKEQIKGIDIFDNSSPRSQRDIKRILALTCAMTYLFQEQRQKIDYKGVSILISEPQDFINTLKISSEFFNQTYSGLDERLTEVLKLIQEYEQEWTPRDYLQEKLGISRNTIKDYCNTLSGEGCIEGVKGSELNLQESLKIYNGNKIYYKRCQKGSKKPLIRCQINELREFLEAKTEKVIDTFDFNELSSINDINNDIKGIKKEGVKMTEDKPNTLPEDEIDTFELTPFSKEDIKNSAPECQELLNKIKLEDSKNED